MPREAIRPRSGSHGVPHPVDASDLACSPTASSTTDWTLPRALRTGRFWWIPAGYFCAFAYAVQVHQTKCLSRSASRFLLSSLAWRQWAPACCSEARSRTVAALSDAQRAGRRRGQLPRYTGSHAPADGLLVRCSGSPATPVNRNRLWCLCGLRRPLVAIPCERPRWTRWTRCAAENPSATRRKNPGSD